MKQIAIAFKLQEINHVSNEVKFSITTTGLEHGLTQYVQLISEGNYIRFRIQIPETQAELLEYAILYGTEEKEEGMGD